MSRESREIAQEALEPDITNLARALFEVGLTTVGPDDLDNRQIAQRLLAGGHVRMTQDRTARALTRVGAGLSMLLMLAAPLSLVPTVWSGDWRWMMSGAVLGGIGFGLGLVITDAGRRSR